jgi:hypothetical protein
VVTLIVVPALYALWFRVHADEDATSAPATSAPTMAADLFPEGMDVQALARWAEQKPTKGTLTEAKEIA